MKLTENIIMSINDSVLCWLATSSLDNIPNVSPKEIFSFYEEDIIIVANIASPQTVKNIRENKHVCISFIDVLKQKGFQLKGEAEIIAESSSEFSLVWKKYFFHLQKASFRSLLLQRLPSPVQNQY